MTAEIAILNTYGVSLAADSAVTISIGENEQKIYNSANKVFTLSKYRPVGIMVFSNSKFMEIEWEIIIKEYRRRLGKNSFPVLFDYAKDFADYLSSTPFIKEEQLDNCFIKLSFTTLYQIKELFLKNIEAEIKAKGQISDSEVLIVLDITLSQIEDKLKTLNDNSFYKLDTDYTRRKIDILKQAIEYMFDKVKIDEARLKRIEVIVESDLQKSMNFPDSSGVVIAGYGDDEIFPSLYSCEMNDRIGKSIILTKENKTQITFNNRAVIVPYAQSEMVSSFMEGVDPLFEREINKEVDVLFEGISGIIQEEFKSKIPDIRNALQSSIREFKRKVYIEPIINMVASLQKSDLAEMAEALVNLTSFKRHVSTEAETVGGPTDVAVITKGDGFVWIKRKHYFDPKLNSHFFANYFREE